MQNIEIVEKFNITLCNENPEKIYVFGDNTLRKGKKGQAIIRDCLNSFGIATKLFPSMDENAFFEDDNIELYEYFIKQDLIKLKMLYDAGFIIVFPKGGIGTGLAKMNEKCPKLFKRLNDYLLKTYEYKNG